MDVEWCWSTGLAMRLITGKKWGILRCIDMKKLLMFVPFLILVMDGYHVIVMCDVFFGVWDMLFI